MPYTNVIDRHAVTVMSGTTHFEAQGKALKLPTDYIHWPGLLKTTMGDGTPFAMSKAIIRQTHTNHTHRKVAVLYVQMSTGITLLVHA